MSKSKTYLTELQTNMLTHMHSTVSSIPRSPRNRNRRPGLASRQLPGSQDYSAFSRLNILNRLHSPLQTPIRSANSQSRNSHWPYVGVSEPRPRILDANVTRNSGNEAKDKSGPGNHCAGARRRSTARAGFTEEINLPRDGGLCGCG